MAHDHDYHAHCTGTIRDVYLVLPPLYHHSMALALCLYLAQDTLSPDSGQFPLAIP